MEARGFDKGHLGGGNREAVDEYLGDKARLEVDLDDGLSKGSVARAGDDRLDHLGQIGRFPAASEGDRQRHRRNRHQPQTRVDQPVGNRARRGCRDPCFGLAVDGSIPGWSRPQTKGGESQPGYRQPE